MDFAYSAEQSMIRDSVAKFVTNEYDFAQRSRRCEMEAGFCPQTWQSFSELGWLGIPFSSQYGGLDGSTVELMILMEEFGRGLVVEPYLSTAVLSGGVIAEAGSEAQKNSLLPSLIAGDLFVAFAFVEPLGRFELSDVTATATRADDVTILQGHKAVVLNGDSANKFIVPVADQHAGGLSLYILDENTPGLSRRSYRTQDGGRACELYLSGVRVDSCQRLGPEGGALSVIEKVIDRATLAVCAEALGAMQATLDMTVEYTKTREQFGVKISSFQALQHRMADMFIEYQQAKSAVIMAALQLDSNPDEASKAVSAAKARVGWAAKAVGQEAIQIHGGIAMTDEYVVGHYFKRLSVIESLFGNSDFHVRRFMAL